MTGSSPESDALRGPITIVPRSTLRPTPENTNGGEESVRPRDVEKISDEISKRVQVESTKRAVVNRVYSGLGTAGTLFQDSIQQLHAQAENWELYQQNYANFMKNRGFKEFLGKLLQHAHVVIDNQDWTVDMERTPPNLTNPIPVLYLTRDDGEVKWFTTLPLREFFKSFGDGESSRKA